MDGICSSAIMGFSEDLFHPQEEDADSLIF